MYAIIVFWYGGLQQSPLLKISQIKENIQPYQNRLINSLSDGGLPPKSKAH
jgi:hypothetical protein